MTPYSPTPASRSATAAKAAARIIVNRCDPRAWFRYSSSGSISEIGSSGSRSATNLRIGSASTPGSPVVRTT